MMQSKEHGLVLEADIAGVTSRSEGICQIFKDKKATSLKISAIVTHPI